MRARRWSSRQSRIAPWSPDISTAGTSIPRNDAGRVYAGASRRPSWNESDSADAASPITPGTIRASRVDEYERGQLAARQDVVADRDLARHKCLADPLVDALVVARDEDEARREREPVGERLRERLAVGREEDDLVDRLALGLGRLEERLDAGEERLGPEHHAALAAVRLVVDLPVVAHRPVPQAVDADLHEALVLRAPQDRVLERAPDQLGEDGDEGDGHG